MDNATRTYIEGNTYPVKEQLKAIGCRWDKDRRAWYAETADVAEKAAAIVKPHPLYNSPPPQDLGTADPAALAIKFGRTPTADAKVISFTGHGNDPSPLGTVNKIRGKRYVKVANGRPRYYSRDMLEDFDMFGDEPGYQYQWDGVEVEPTEAELAVDQAEVEAKTARERAVAVLKLSRANPDQRRVPPGVPRASGLQPQRGAAPRRSPQARTPDGRVPVSTSS